MEFYIDTANLAEIKKAVEYGVISGATTNPSILAKEGNISPKQRILEIIELVKGPVSVEVLALDAEGMIKEAVEYDRWSPNVVVKIPIIKEGLKAVKKLSSVGIKTNVTVCMNSSQALLAAMNGATYVSLFYGRIGDMGYDPVEVIKETKMLFEREKLDSKIIIGSIRSVLDINRSISAGADIITIPYKFLEMLIEHPKTDETVKEFLNAWSSVKR